MYWKDEILVTVGDIADAAIEVARYSPSQAPIFLAAYAATIQTDTPVLTAVENLTYMASHYSEQCFREIAQCFGTPSLVRTLTEKKENA